MAEYVSKVSVNGITYDLKDILARKTLDNFVNASSPVFKGSIQMEGCIASGTLSTAEGNNTTAAGDYSHAEGSDTIAQGTNSHAEGDHTTAIGNASHSEGSGSYNATTDTWTYNTASGEASHVEGYTNIASGKHSHAEGCETEASGHASHAEGCTNTAAASYSHIEGHSNVITSTVDADGNNETGVAAHVEGAGNQTAASYSHVEGYNNKAGINASCVHVSGINNEANYGNNLLVVGKYNDNKEEDIFEFGNGYVNVGEDNSQEIIRKNALRIANNNRMYIYLDDIIFMTKSGGDERAYSVADAVLIDDALNISSTRPVQNKVLTEKINEVFQSVSEGKKLLANALTEKGVPASMEMTFDELASAILSIDISTVDDRYLFARDSAYVSNEGQVVAIPTLKTDADFINFYDYIEIEGE